ncbi:MAG: hypothetical protein E7436_01935 [Ruminococcaceae bacterium]|nr:hypothetical protein [Oscillospiraceae bacterium]
MEQLKQRIDALLEHPGPVILGIDGPCASGKTTLAARLQAVYDCNVFHMDDFFLRPHQRTPERFAETGGNVDYERFREEVLIPLKTGLPFSYRPFNCAAFILEPPVEVTPKKLSVIEGTYSNHPYFGDPYDLKIFLTVSPEMQRRRILKRPSFLHRRFFEEWIPMEQQYFHGFQIQNTCDLVF